MRIDIKAVLLSAVVFLLCSSVCTYGENRKQMPFRPGEKLVFVLKWVNIPAGRAVLRVDPVTVIRGKKAYRFVMMARTNKFVDFFYKVRDRIDSYADIKMNHSVFFKKKQKEGSYKKYFVVDFNWRKRQAEYFNRGKARKTISLLPGSFDPLSAFYFTRMLDLSGKKIVKRPVTDGKKNVIGVINVISRQNLKLNGKIYDTFLLEPELKHVGGVFKKSKKAKIQLWITADSRRIPVMIKSRVAVGTFSGELISVENILPDNAESKAVSGIIGNGSVSECAP